MLRSAVNLSPINTSSKQHVVTYLVWRRRHQNPASVAKHWTSFWESSLECCSTATVVLKKWTPPFFSQNIVFLVVFKGYLQHCRSFSSLKSPVSGSSLFSSLLISLLISLCWRSRSSSLAVRSSQDLERESG